MRHPWRARARGRRGGHNTGTDSQTPWSEDVERAAAAAAAAEDITDSPPETNIHSFGLE